MCGVHHKIRRPSSASNLTSAVRVLPVAGSGSSVVKKMASSRSHAPAAVRDTCRGPCVRSSDAAPVPPVPCPRPSTSPNRSRLPREGRHRVPEQSSNQDHPQHRESNENLDEGEAGGNVASRPKPETGPSRALSSTKLCLPGPVPGYRDRYRVEARAACPTPARAARGAGAAPRNATRGPGPIAVPVVALPFPRNPRRVGDLAKCDSALDTACSQVAALRTVLRELTIPPNRTCKAISRIPGPPRPRSG